MSTHLPRLLVPLAVVSAALALPAAAGAAPRMMAGAVMSMHAGGNRPAPMMMTPMMGGPPRMMFSPGFMPQVPNPSAVPGFGGFVPGFGYGMASGYGTGSGYGMRAGYGMSSGYGMGSGYGSSATSPARSPGDYGGSVPELSTRPQPAGLDWPLGVRLLDDADPLKREVELLTQTAYAQAAEGRVNPEVVSRAVRDVDELRGQVSRQLKRGAVAEYTIQEALRFLDDLKDTLRAL